MRFVHIATTMSEALTIRPCESADWESIWHLLEPVFRAGESYIFSPEITESEAREVWIEKPLVTFVAEQDGEILGTYYLKPNQPGLGSHICNCGYVVAEPARGRGIASQMCAHSQTEAMARGFLGMQFNLVVASNEPAIRLWRKHGFQIIGTIPGGFRKPDGALVDTHIMFKSLKPE